VVFALSAGIAGLAGALFVPQVGIIAPKQLDITASIEIVIWVAVGGRGSLVGAILGALLVNTGKSVISTARPDIWQFIMGGLFVGVVLLFPKGLIGSLGDTIQRFRPDSRKNYPSRPAESPGIEVETASLAGGESQ
jgi:urea transport system permease protein